MVKILFKERTFGASTDIESFTHGMKQQLSCCLLWEVEVTCGILKWYIQFQESLLAPLTALVVLAEVRGKRYSLIMTLGFVLVQVARPKIPKFPKVSFGWAKNVKACWHCSRHQVKGKKKLNHQSQSWNTILDKPAGKKGRKTFQPFLQLSCCHLCCNGQVLLPLPLYFSSNFNINPVNVKLTTRYLSKLAMSKKKEI